MELNSLPGLHPSFLGIVSLLLLVFLIADQVFFDDLQFFKYRNDEKYWVKPNSFLRKLYPFIFKREKKLRPILYIRIVPIFIYSIINILVFIFYIVYFLFLQPIIPDFFHSDTYLIILCCLVIPVYIQQCMRHNS